MTRYYYIDDKGQKRGLIDDNQLRTLVGCGIITPYTPLETDKGHKLLAEQIPGLFDTASSPFVQKTHTVPHPPRPTPSISIPKKGQLFCTNCGSSVSARAVVCDSCGAKPIGHKKFCRKCGTGLNPEQVICVNCKAAIKTDTSTLAPVSATGTAFLVVIGCALSFGCFSFGYWLLGWLMLALALADLLRWIRNMALASKNT